MFPRLYVSCEVHGGDLNDFFQHENQACPPSLSHFGSIRPRSKSNLVACLERGLQKRVDKLKVNSILLDGAAIVNMLK